MSSSVRVAVYVQPRAKRTEIAGRHGADIRVRVAAPPIDQAANEALLGFLAQRLGVRRREVRLIAGATSRRKVLEIDGLTAEQVQALLARTRDAAAADGNARPIRPKERPAATPPSERTGASTAETPSCRGGRRRPPRDRTE